MIASLISSLWAHPPLAWTVLPWHCTAFAWLRTRSAAPQVQHPWALLLFPVQVSWGRGCAVLWAPGQEHRARAVQRANNKHCRTRAALPVSLRSEPRPAASPRSQAQPNQGGGWKGSLAYFAPSQHIPGTPALGGFTELAVCYTHLAVSLNSTFGKSYLP